MENQKSEKKTKRQPSKQRTSLKRARVRDTAHKATEQTKDGHPGYCSACFEKTWHELKETSLLGRDSYTCTACGCQTLMCRAPGCPDMAQDTGILSYQFCAAHAGIIPGFERLSQQLDAIEDYEQLFEPDVVNWSNTISLTTSVLGGALLLGPLAYAAVPAASEAVGTTFLGARVAAAVSSGWTALGLGSTAAEGLGMAGGTALISAAGAVAGGALSGATAYAYFSDIADFKVVRLKEGTEPSIIILNGFLTQDTNQEREWLPTLSKFYPKNRWYLVEWESQRMKDLGQLALTASSPLVLRTTIQQAAGTAIKSAALNLAPVSMVLSALGLASNSWHVAMVKAEQTGKLLADILARTPAETTFVLMGHSLGARVAYYTLETLAKKKLKKIQTAHLLGGAVGKDPAQDWDKAAGAVSGSLHNYYSLHDQVLRAFYSSGTFFLGSPPIGRHPITARDSKILNHDVSQFVDGHSAFKVAMPKFFAGASKQSSI